MAMYDYRNECTRNECRACLEVKVRNTYGTYCNALYDTRDYQRGKKVCPFYKTVDQYEAERADLKARGHIIERMDVHALDAKAEQE